MPQNASQEKIYAHPVLNSVLDSLLFNQFVRGKTKLAAREILPDQLKHSVWLASILASSDDERHQVKAQLFTSLLYLEAGSDKDVERVCYLLMSRLGNLVATKLFQGVIEQVQERSFESTLRLDSLLSFELAFQRETKTIDTGSGRIVTTGFQRKLWEEMGREKRLAVSAPTSAGKSFITKKHIKQLFSASEEVMHCIYIVPSRALINQVSEEFREELDGLASVYTAFLENIGFEQNSIYVVTPERCLRLLKLAVATKLKFDLIFIDEIQNIEDENGRGTLLEYVAEELERIFPQAQFIIAGPNLTGADVLLGDMLNGKAAEVKTSVSPVIQMRSVISGKGEDTLAVKILSNIEDDIAFDLPVDFNLERDFGKNIATGLSRIIDFFGHGEQSIIYSPRTDYAEKWARHYSQGQGETFVPDRKLTEFIEYLIEEIHPQYYLIDCLKKGVAFHHGKLPELVRKEVEDCFSEKSLEKIFCTSTLIEGVNLPAINLFLTVPKKLNDPLSEFEFGNLIGRAGRLSESLYGNIYCIEREEHKGWAKEYFEKPFEKKVVPSTRRALEDFDSLISKAELRAEQFDRNSDIEKNAVIFFRHKYRNDVESFGAYLERKGLSAAQITELAQRLSRSVENLEIPVEMSRNNPTIDPLQQDLLYGQVLQSGIESWVVHYGPNIRKPMKKAEIEDYAVKDRNLYWQMTHIMEKLDAIFQIKMETGYNNQIWRTMPQMCLYGVKWLDGQPYSKIILDDIAWKIKRSSEEYPFDENDPDQINEVINDLAQINSIIVSHVLVKYLKLLNDILEPIMTDEQREKFKFSLSLPGMLELGTTNAVVLQLIAGGVSRSVALKVNSLFEKVPGHEDINVFDWLRSKQSLNLKPIYNRYLSKLKLLKKPEQKSS